MEKYYRVKKIADYADQITAELKAEYPDLHIKRATVNKLLSFFTQNIIFVFMKWRSISVHLKWIKIVPQPYTKHKHYKYTYDASKAKKNHR